MSDREPRTYGANIDQRQHRDGLDPAEQPLIGGRYRVLRLLGQGGMGAVYEAENTWTKRRVALKLMRPEVANRADFVRRFMHEAQSAALLAHPNIVDVLDMGEDPEHGTLYIVQGFLTGRDLRALLRAEGRLTVQRSIALLAPVMEALVLAHSRGIVHRDLKPDNIFLAETPRGVVPTLIDFGIVKVTSDDGAVTSAGALLGTPFYMAPEQARGDTTLDARADVWSLGVVLYEMLAGVRPASAPNSSALIARIIYEDPRPLAEVAPDLPADVTAVVMGALQRDPQRRHPSMQAFLDALRACASSMPATMVWPSPQRREDARAEGTSRADTGAETLTPRVDSVRSITGARRAPRWGRWVVGVLALLALPIAFALRPKAPSRDVGPAERAPRPVAPSSVRHPAPVRPPTTEATLPPTPAAPAAPAPPPTTRAAAPRPRRRRAVPVARPVDVSPTPLGPVPPPTVPVID